MLFIATSVAVTVQVASAPDAAAATVSDWATLQSEFAGGGEVTLGADISRSDGAALRVGVGKSVVLDLAGHALSITGAAGVAAVGVPAGASLTVRDSQSGGQLTAAASTGGTGSGNVGAGIGSDAGQTAGTITIEGGTVVATGAWGGTPKSSAGIGGGNRGSGGTVVITGGSVTATGGGLSDSDGGAGIGGGSSGSGGNFSMTGGTVVAVGGGVFLGGAGIGVGGNTAGATISISGGRLTARGGSRAPGVGGTGASVTISDGVVDATGGSGGPYGGPGIGTVNGGGTVAINGGTVTATGGAATQAGAGIGGSGIGRPLDDINISGGAVTATGGAGPVSGAAGLAAGNGDHSGGSDGRLTVTAGTVTAIGGQATSSAGAGIGSSGGAVSSGQLRFDGGTVTATGGTAAADNGVARYGGAGIGGGGLAPGADVDIRPGARVSATQGNGNSPTALGAGGSTGGPPAFGSLSNAGTLTIPPAATLTVPAGITVENSGTLVIQGTLDGAGTVHNSGTIDPQGTIANNGDGHSGHLAVTEHNYFLSYDPHGGSGPIPAAQHVYAPGLAAAGLQLPPAPTKAASVFTGWYLDGGRITDTTDLTGLGESGPVALTLVAGFADAEQTVRFDTDGGSTVATQTVPYGTPATRPADPTKPGHTFLGWYTTAAGDPVFDFATPITTPTTVYAHFAADQTIHFTSAAPADAEVGGHYQAAAVGGESGRPVVLSIDSTAATVCSIDAAGLVTFHHPGTCVVNANQAAAPGYNAANQVDQVVPVGKAGQSITFTSVPQTATAGGASYTVIASATSGLTPVAFASTTPGVCTVIAAAVTFKAAGTCTIRADQPGDDTHAAATAEQTFAVRAAMAAGDVFIADTNNNRIVEVPADGGPQTTVGTDLTGPHGVAVDAAGDVFIADTFNNRVVKVPAGGGVQTTIGSGLDEPYGVAVDTAGNVYIADTANRRVVRVPADGGPQTTIGTGLLSAYGVAVDAVGNVYIADTTNRRVVRVPADGGPQTAVGTVLDGPFGVTVDADADVLIADGYLGQVVKVPAGGGPFSPVGTGLSFPVGVAIDPVGDVFIADGVFLNGFGNSQVVKVPVGGGPQITIGAGLDNPNGVAVFAPPPTLTAAAPPTAGTVGVPYAGYTYTAAAPAGEPAATFRVATGALPDGLTLDPVTGGLTGTPTTAGAFTFRVQAQNAATAALGPSTMITIAPVAQTITFTSTPDHAAVGGSYQVTATGGPSGQPVTFSTSSPACTVTGSTVTFLHAGTCVVDADQAGTSNYAAAPTVTQTITIDKTGQTITLTSTPPQHPAVGGSFVITAVGGGSTAPLTYTIAPASAGVCTFTGTATLTFTALGACTVYVEQAGDPDHQAASPVTVTITVDTAPPAFTTTDRTLPDGTVGVPYTEAIADTGTPTPVDAVTAGTIPPGLTLTGDPVLSGTPTTPGTYTFTLTATNRGGTATATYTITINPARTTTTTSTTTSTTLTTSTTTTSSTTTSTTAVTTTMNTPPPPLAYTGPDLPIGPALTAALTALLLGAALTTRRNRRRRH